MSRVDREGCTIKVDISGDELLKLATALEMYPEAVTIEVSQDSLTRRTYSWDGPNKAVIGTVWDGNPYSYREEEPDVYPDELSYSGYVKIDRYVIGIHLEQAPDEWTEFINEYSSASIILSHVRNYIPKFDVPARVDALLQRITG